MFHDFMPSFWSNPLHWVSSNIPGWFSVSHHSFFICFFCSQLLDVRCAFISRHHCACHTASWHHIFWLLLMSLFLVRWQINLFIEKAVCVHLCLFLCVLLVEDEAEAKAGLIKYSHLSSLFFLLFLFHYFVAEEILGFVDQFSCLLVNYLWGCEPAYLAFCY